MTFLGQLTVFGYVWSILYVLLIKIPQITRYLLKKHKALANFVKEMNKLRSENDILNYIISIELTCLDIFKTHIQCTISY